MSADFEPNDPHAPVDVELKNNKLAALLAWLWPGAGHLYQGRYGKGVLFMVCILGTFFFGLTLGGGRVVYASFTKSDMRYSYIWQFGVGLPALPAVIQSQRVIVENEPPLLKGFMAPPRQPVREQHADELASWHKQLHGYFELGTLYTMIAGLLNILVIYDAFAGPVFPVPEGKPDRVPLDKQTA